MPPTIEEATEFVLQTLTATFGNGNYQPDQKLADWHIGYPAGIPALIIAMNSPDPPWHGLVVIPTQGRMWKTIGDVIKTASEAPN